MVLPLELFSSHAIAFRLRVETPAPRRARATGLRGTRVSTVRCSAGEPLPQERPCPCCAGWGRRSFLRGAAPLALISAALPNGTKAETGGTSSISDPLLLGASDVARSRKPGWYKEFFASSMNDCMQSYEAEIAQVKGDLFNVLNQEQGTVTRNVLEIGVGTGPNLKYYAGGAAGGSSVQVYGVDPNEKMEKYARTAAEAAGLGPASFRFVQGVAESLPVRDSSMDAVIGTLVMCSVNDVNVALREVKRVLKPGGCYVFIEHVAAQDGSFLQFLQNILNPLQQFLVDGCHLNRETGKLISETGFAKVQINRITVPNLFVVGPHVYGVARK